MNETKWSVLTYQPAKQIVAYAASINLANIKNGVINETATWTKSSGKFEVLEGQKIEPAKRYFRVGTAEVSCCFYSHRKQICIKSFIFLFFKSLPWSLKKRDAAGNEVKDDEGKLIWTGYCIDFIHELSVKMNFDYDIVEPKDGTFGSKQNGQWNGCVGDLAKGVSVINPIDSNQLASFIFFSFTPLNCPDDIDKRRHTIIIIDLKQE